MTVHSAEEQKVALVIYSVIKVTDKPEFAQSFRKGLLHFQKVKSFRDGLHDDSQRHDEYEGVIATFQPGKVRIEFNNAVINGNDITSPILMHDNSLLEKYAFCMYSINSKNWTTIAEDQIEAFKTDMVVDSSIGRFGDHSTIILNVAKFIARVQSAVQSKGYACRMGLVEYYDVNVVNEMFAQKRFGFQKTDKLRAQNEFRIIMDSNPTSNDEPWDFEIGNIEDITATIPTRDLRGSFRMEMQD